MFQQYFWYMDRLKSFFRWKLQTNQDVQIMEVYRTKSAYIWTSLKPASRGSYYKGKSSAWKICLVIPPAITKGGGNKSGGYTSAYEPQIDLQKKAKRYGWNTQRDGACGNYQQNHNTISTHRVRVEEAYIGGSWSRIHQEDYIRTRGDTYWP